MIISVTKLHQLLAEKTDAETAEALTSYIEVKIEKSIENKSSQLATKEDIAKVYTEIAKAKTEMIKWYVALFVMLTLMIAGLYLKK